MNRIKLGRAILISLLMSGLVSCGGGSSSASSSTTATTIAFLSPVGVVAPATPITLTIYGTNFWSGMSVSVTDKDGFPIFQDISPTVLSSTMISTSFNITAVPTGNYVNITVIPIDGTPPVTAVLGVAGTARTLFADVQPILDANCGTCHDGSPANGFLDMSSFAATASANPTGMIGIPSYNCSPKFRLVPGDPRRTSSVLIDKIQAHLGQPACSGDPMPPLSSPQISGAEIQAIIDWVAGGAY